MGLFDPKKKSDNLKTLSETDIQSRLYGGFRKPHLEEREQTAKSEAKASGVTVDNNTRPSTKTSDLFNITPTTTRLVPSSDNVNSAADSSSKKAPSIPDWMSKEQEDVSLHIGKLREKTSANVDSVSSLGQASKPVISLFSKFFAGLASIVQWVTGLVFGVILSVVSFFKKKAGIRQSQSKSNYWFVGVVALILIMIGIHALNNQRERAMKTSVKASQKKVAFPSDVESAQVKLATSIKQPESAMDGLSNNKLSDVKKEEKKVLPKGQNQVADSVKPYVIQVATYASLADAEKKLSIIKAGAFPGFIVSLKRQSGRVYHCVFVGRFSDYEEAEKSLNLFKKKEFAGSFPDAFVRSLK